MRHRLAHGEGNLVQVELAGEEHGQDVGCAARLRFGKSHHAGQMVAVVVVQLLDARVQALEGFAVRGQGERVGVQRRKFVDRVQKLLQRVALGLHIEHADVGGNARQHHVAANKHPRLAAIQRNVFRCMPVAADAAPVPPADAQGLAVLHTHKTGRQCGHHGGKIAGTGADFGYRVRVGQAVLLKEFCGTGPAVAAGVGDVVLGHEVVGGADPQWRAPARAQPGG